MKILIKNGEIIDGSGKKRYKADLLINEKLIEAIDESITPPNDVQVIDATGCVVTPGFIDIHRHFDSAMLQEDSFGILELRQGITSSICGNCGLSPVPANSKTAPAFNQYLKPVMGEIPERFTHYTYETYSAYMQSAKTRINTGFLAGAGAIAYSTYGWQTRGFTNAERQRATSLVKEAMDCGAKGLSFGIMYQPECWLAEEDHIAMASQIHARDRLLCTHIRGEGDTLLPSIEEVIRIAKKAEVRLNISHFKATGKKNWRNLVFKAIDILETAIQDGQSISVDFYPYDGGATTLLSLIPPTMYPESKEDFAFFSTNQGKNKLRKEIQKNHANWDNMIRSIGWDRILISSVTASEFIPLQGLSLQQAAHTVHCDDPSDLLAELLAKDGLGIGVILLSMDYEDVKQIASLPYSCIISDALYGSMSFPHPRLYGAFPKALKDFSVAADLLSIEQAISKMTYLPASRINILNRGLLKKDNYADILIFNPHTMTSEATYSHPNRFASGIDHVFINGHPVLLKDTILPGHYGSSLVSLR